MSENSNIDIFIIFTAIFCCPLVPPGGHHFEKTLAYYNVPILQHSTLKMFLDSIVHL